VARGITLSISTGVVAQKQLDLKVTMDALLITRASVSRRALIAGIATVLSAPTAFAASKRGDISLIMVDDPNCSYCRKFEAEIGGRYPKMAQGRFAPLFKVRRKSPELAQFNPVIYTPTFLLIRGTDEVGRITGYPGADYFFAELDPLLAKAGFMPGLSQPSASTRPQRGI
jgi:hypothetical protein